MNFAGFKENNVGLLLQSSCDLLFLRKSQLINPDASELIYYYGKVSKEKELSSKAR